MNVIALLCLLTALLPLPAWGHVDSISQDQDAESRLIAELNRDREQHGLPPLRVHQGLTQVAREHSRRMADANQLSHQFAGEDRVSARIASTNLRFHTSGENVGLNSSLEGVEPEFMDSPPHRANILNPKYDRVGIGVVEKDGVLWVTQDFAGETANLPPADAENAATQAFNQLRRQKRQPALQRRDMPEVRNLACTMAQHGDLDTRAALRSTKAHYAVVYTQSRPGQLPTSAVDLSEHNDLGSFAVGACFTRENKNPGGIYYVVMVFF